jgi:uncharacterized membrane protein YphA (DoxX/SURF4 family)
MRTSKIIFWISTGFIFLFQGVMPALTGHTELAKEGIRHLGYPPYFGVLLNLFKVLGAIALVIPALHPRVKEWAYAGFAFDFLFAALSLWIVDGFSLMVLFPFVMLAILIISYVKYHQLKRRPVSEGGLLVSKRRLAGRDLA